VKRRQKEILSALKVLGGEASARDIAERLDLSVNGVSQSLGALSVGGYIESIHDSGRTGDLRWRTRREAV
jgi:predicted transcriptional regulator